MSDLRSTVYQTIILLFLLSTGTFITAAQLRVFNIPSTDTQPEKTIYIEGDLFAHFASYGNGGFQSFAPYVVYGVSKNIDIGANLNYTRGGSSTALELQPNIKWKPYVNQENGVAVSVGTLAFIPLNRAAGTRSTAQLYVNVSKTIQSANNMKLTGGIYQMVNAKDDFGTRTGAMLGLQQPLTKKLTLLVDWSSGKNRFGYSTAGLCYEFSKSQYLGIGYSFGNSGRGNNYLTAFYGFTL